jgi:group I intron endonuclease
MPQKPFNGKIYCITNLFNGKYYIGQTIQGLNQRYNRHCRANTNLHLKSAIKKYGRKNFVIEPLVENIQTQEDLDNLERLWILSTRSYDRKVGYNIELGGKGRGKVSDESKAKISAFNKGKILSPETRAKMSASMKGKTHSPETRKKISDSKKGKNKGKIPSPETRAKISASGKGRFCSPETRKKISASNKGKNKGKILSPETRAKMSASQKARYKE